MDSDPPSFVPPPSSNPPRPGSPSYRSSSAPTTSVAPPPVPPSVVWPIVRLLIAVGMLLLASQAAANQDPDARGVLFNALLCFGIALAMAVPPMILARYRSLRMFSWLLLIAAFFQLYVRRDGLFGSSMTTAHITHPKPTSRSPQA